jgi:hypothetical protein
MRKADFSRESWLKAVIAPRPDYRATKLRRRMRRRVRSRVLRSARTATRNFDLELAISTSPSRSRNLLITRHCTRDKPAVLHPPIFSESPIAAIIDPLFTSPEHWLGSAHFAEWSACKRDRG